MSTTNDKNLSLLQDDSSQHSKEGDKTVSKVGKPFAKKYEEIHFVDKQQSVWKLLIVLR